MVKRELAITEADAAVFAAGVRRLASLEPEEIHAALSLFRVKLLGRGQYLLRAGQFPTKVALVVRGLLREYFSMPDGVERTKSFVREGEHSGSLADLLTGRPSHASIVAEEPSRLLIADYAECRALASHSPGWARFERSVLEQLLIVKAEREYELLGLDAEARYARFGTRFPGLEARAAARQIASYLGITPVHLSRLRGRRQRKRNA